MLHCKNFIGLVIPKTTAVFNNLQEFIGDPIQAAFFADNYNFSSSGREDVDVRMLGTGRPFVIELLNARHSTMTSEDLELLQQKINAQTEDVSVRGLTVSQSEVLNVYILGMSLKLVVRLDFVMCTEDSIFESLCFTLKV